MNKIIICVLISVQTFAQMSVNIGVVNKGFVGKISVHTKSSGFAASSQLISDISFGKSSKEIVDASGNSKGYASATSKIITYTIPLTLGIHHKSCYYTLGGWYNNHFKYGVCANFCYIVNKHINTQIDLFGGGRESIMLTLGWKIF